MLAAAAAEFVWNEKTLAVVMVFAIPIVAIIGGLWYKIEQVKSVNHLKRRMIERGMSVDEIERVIKAGNPPADD
jgi:hypothetical protein